MALRASFDAVIVGSGFGGSVMAHELSGAGRSVCVLERGKRYPPRSFPRAPYAVARNFWDPSEGRYGMFAVWSFKHSEALVSSALGGGSIIYANVLIRKPPAWFAERMPDGSWRPWPVTRDDLDPHYDAVEQMLGAARYPDDVEPYQSTPKMLALKAAAQSLGLTWYRPNLAVTFGNPGQPPRPGEPIDEPGHLPNLHHERRFTCRLCGECDIGCNYGSKNTLDYNYLTHAQRAGADIRDLSEVREFRRTASGWEVDYVTHDPARWEGRPRETRALPVTTLTCRHLVVAAGTFGTAYLLLKNRDRGNLPGISAALGQRYSPNGDLLSFAMRCRESSARGAAPRILDPSFGTVITSTIERLSGPDGEPQGGFYLQDAGYPQFINWLAEVADAPGRIGRAVRYLVRRVREGIMGVPDTEIGGALGQLLGACELSSASTPLLGMGRDVPGGQFSLHTGRNQQRYLDLSWKAEQSARHYDDLTSVARQVAGALGGRFKENPAVRFLGRSVTVHPVGGCAMGRNDGEGVVDAYGRVFNLPGLYVADGSVMPGPVGPNPSLTIAALSRRFAHGILEQP